MHQLLSLSLSERPGPSLVGPRLDCRKHFLLCHATYAPHYLVFMIARVKEQRAGFGVQSGKEPRTMPGKFLFDRRTKFIGCFLPLAVPEYFKLRIAPNGQPGTPSEFMALQVWENCGRTELIIGNQNSVVGALQS